MDTSENEVVLYCALDEFITDCMIFLTMLMLVYNDIVKRRNRRIRRRTIRYNMGERIPAQISHLRRIIEFGDVQCIVNLRMSRDAFARLCYLLENVGGLAHSRYSRIDEKVSMFLSILAHHKKNHIIGHDYIRSGYTVSKNFHDVLRCVLRLHTILVSPPSPVTEDCSSEKWKFFKGCLGALDGTYIGVQVPNLDKPKYRELFEPYLARVLVPILGVAKHLESANTMFSFIWWIIGFYWVSAGGQSLTAESPQLYWLCITFLAFDVFFVVICVAVACVIGIAVCCCLPCIIAILYAVADQEGATKEDIERLPKFKFRKIGDFEKQNGEIQESFGGIMTECETDPPSEHVLPLEDAECCICLTSYDDGTELRELPCRHHFHLACIDKWLYMNATCPLCKFNILKNGNQSGSEEV